MTEKTSHVFGLIGSAAIKMFDNLYDAKDINFNGVHDERIATHMGTGLPQAKAAFMSVVSFAGLLAHGHIYRDVFREVDQQSLFTLVTKKRWWPLWPTVCQSCFEKTRTA